MVVEACAVTVWWPTIKFKTSGVELRKLQWPSFLGIIGPMRMALAAAIRLSSDCTWSWRQRPEQESADSTAMNSGSPDLKNMSMHTCLGAWKNTSYRWRPSK